MLATNAATGKAVLFGSSETSRILAAIAGVCAVTTAKSIQYLGHCIQSFLIAEVIAGLTIFDLATTQLC
jgi:hypothetical protein